MVASRKCFTGKMSPTVRIHAGESSVTVMNTPDRNRSGRMIAFTTAGPASAFGTIAVVASPSAENAIPPTMIVTMNSNSLAPVGTSASYTMTPKATVITTRSMAITIAWTTRADR